MLESNLMDPSTISAARAVGYPYCRILRYLALCHQTFSIVSPTQDRLYQSP